MTEMHSQRVAQSIWSHCSRVEVECEDCLALVDCEKDLMSKDSLFVKNKKVGFEISLCA